MVLSGGAVVGGAVVEPGAVVVVDAGAVVVVSSGADVLVVSREPLSWSSTLM